MLRPFGLVRAWRRSAARLSSRISGLLTVIAAVLGPTALAFWRPGNAIFIGTGALGWAAAVAVKRAGWRAAGAIPPSPHLAPALRPALNGLWSALCELGLAMLLMRTVCRPDNVGQAMAFGAGAASLEVLYLLGLGLRRAKKAPAPLPDAFREAAARSYLIQNMFFVERLLASGVHIASRVLLFESLRSGMAWPALAAAAAFASIDGTASLGHSRRWNWFDPVVAGRYYGFVAAMVVLESCMVIVLQVDGPG